MVAYKLIKGQRPKIIMPLKEKTEENSPGVRIRPQNSPAKDSDPNLNLNYLSL